MRSGYVAFPSAYAPILQLEAQFYQINLDLKETIQKINAPDLKVVYRETMLDVVFINGEPLKSVYANYQISKQDPMIRWIESINCDNFYNKVIKFFLDVHGYRIHQELVSQEGSKPYIVVSYILRPFIPDIVVVSKKK